MANGFAKGFQETFKTGVAVGASAAQEAISERIKKQAEKAEKERKKLEAQEGFIAASESLPDKIRAEIEGLDIDKIPTDSLNSITTAILKSTVDPDEDKKFVTAEQVEAAAQASPGATVSGKTAEGLNISRTITNIKELVQKEVAEATVGETFDVREEKRKPGVAAATAEATAKATQDIEFQNKQFDKALSSINETIKALQERGGFSPAQLTQIRTGLTEEMKTEILGQETDVEAPFGRDTKGTPKQTDENQAFFDFMNNPLPPKKTQKQQEKEETMNQGRRLIGEARTRFFEIAEKHGVGRFAGLVTKIRGGLGELIPKKEQAPEVAAYEGMLDGLAVFVGRNVYTDDRVSKDDRVAYKKGLASVLNTEEEATLMFDILDKFSETGDPVLASVIKTITPKKGNGMLPSIALESAGVSKTSVLSREEKIRILKERRKNAGRA